MASLNHPQLQWSHNNPSNTNYSGIDNDQRQISRTPSPTPSELKEMSSGSIDWKAFGKRKFWFRREWLWYYVLLVVFTVIFALLYLYHKQIVQWLTPVTTWLHTLKFGWLVPIGVLFVLSFPPLFGHEIVAVLCGLVWGLWAGFGIVAAGTLLGEIGNFYAFKYCCRARAEKAEKGKIWYACLAKVVRDGGFKIALIARLSAIPGHFTTALFAASGMNILVFTVAAILSMPKQFITVYLGVILMQSDSGTENKSSKIISDTVLAVTVLITIIAMWYIFHLMNKAKPEVIHQRRKARQEKLARSEQYPYMHQHREAGSSDVFNPLRSEADIPLTTTTHEPQYQQWDQHGKAIGYVPDPNIRSPAPKTATSAKALEEGTRNPFADSRDDLAAAEWDMGKTTIGSLSNSTPFNSSTSRQLLPPKANSGSHSPNLSLISGAPPPARPGSNNYETDYSHVAVTQPDHTFNPYSKSEGLLR